MGLPGPPQESTAPPGPLWHPGSPLWHHPSMRSGAFGFSSGGLPGLVSVRLHVDLRRKMPRGALAAPPAGDPRGSMHPMKRQGVVLEATLAGRQPFMSLWPLRTRREHLRREHRRPLWAVVTQQFADRERAADREQASGDRPDLQERRGRTISRTTSMSIPLMISTSRCFEIGLRSNSIVPRSMDSKLWPSTIEKRPLDALCC